MYCDLLMDACFIFSANTPPNVLNANILVIDIWAQSTHFTSSRDNEFKITKLQYMKILNLYDVCILPATMNFLFCITFLPYIYPYKVFQGLSYIYPYKVFCHIFTLLRSFRDALFEIVTRLNIYAPQLSNWLCIVLMIWCRIVNCEETRYIVIGKNADELFECV